MLSFMSPLTSAFSFASAAPGLILGIAVGVLAYRYMLVKNPTLLNTLVTKAKTDIDDIEALVTKKKAALPTAVAASVAVAPTLAPVTQAAPVMPAVVAPVSPVAVAAPVAVAPVVAQPVVAQPVVAAPAA